MMESDQLLSSNDSMLGFAIGNNQIVKIAHHIWMATLTAVQKNDSDFLVMYHLVTKVKL